MSLRCVESIWGKVGYREEVSGGRVCWWLGISISENISTWTISLKIFHHGCLLSVDQMCWCFGAPAIKVSCSGSLNLLNPDFDKLSPLPKFSQAPLCPVLSYISALAYKSYKSSQHKWFCPSPPSSCPLCPPPPPHTKRSEQTNTRIVSAAQNHIFSIIPAPLP